MRPPSSPQLLLIFLEIVVLSVLIYSERAGAIGGIEYGAVLLGIVILFAFLTKTARSSV